MRISISPTKKMERLPGEGILDILFGLGALVVLVPAIPVLVLVYLLDWVWSRFTESKGLERELRYRGE